MLTESAGFARQRPCYAGARNRENTMLTRAVAPAADVKCTFDLVLGKGQDKLRLNPRKAWYRNLEDIVTEGDTSVTFIMKRAQPAFPMLLASAYGPIYPCHVPPAQMRTHPIGTGPFKFVEFKPNEYIKLAKNSD